MPQSFMDSGLVPGAELESWYGSGCSTELGPAEFCRPVAANVAIAGTDEHKFVPTHLLPVDCVPVLSSQAADVVAFRFDWYTGEVRHYIRTWVDTGNVVLWSGTLRGAILRDVALSGCTIDPSAHVQWAAGVQLLTGERAVELMTAAEDMPLVLSLKLEEISERYFDYEDLDTSIAAADLRALREFPNSITDEWASVHFAQNRAYLRLGDTQGEAQTLLAALRCNTTTDKWADRHWPRLRELGILIPGSWEDRVTRLASFTSGSTEFFLAEARTLRGSDNAKLALEFYYRALFGYWAPVEKPLDALVEFAELSELCGAKPLSNMIRARAIPAAKG
jgi:hypothetical protein